MMQNAIAPIFKDNFNASQLMQWCKRHEKDECKILSKEEEIKLIESLKDDPKKLQEALILHNVALAFNVAARFMQGSKSFDELVANALYGLCYAAKKYDPNNEKKAKFSTYAYSWIYKYCWGTYWRDSEDEKDVMRTAISLDSGIQEMETDEDDGSLGNYLQNHMSTTFTSEANKSIEDTMEHNAMRELFQEMKQYVLSSDFTDTDRLVFSNAFADNSMSLRKISADFDLPLKDVKNSYEKILSLMKNKLAESGICSLRDVF